MSFPFVWRRSIHAIFPCRKWTTTTMGRRLYSAASQRPYTLLVSNLPWDTDKEELESKIWTALGRGIVPKKTQIYYENAQSLGFGTVEFATDEESKNAREELNRKQVVLEGRSLLVSTPQEEAPRHGIIGEKQLASLPPSQDKKQTKKENRPKKHITSYVLVENIPPGMGWRNLKSIFKDHSPKFAEFLPDNTALVSLFGTRQAQDAVQQINGVEHSGSVLKLTELPRDSLGRPILQSKKQQGKRQKRKHK